MLLFNINDQSQVSETRRIIINAITHLNPYTEYLGKISILVTELSTNLIKHTKTGGKILFSCNPPGDYCTIISIDKGTGIKNIAESLKDGFSTKGTMGGGLGAIKRMSDFFDIYSSPDGTVVISVLHLKKDYQNDFYKFGSVTVPKPGETVSGDNYNCKYLENRSFFIVADGLGHGLNAAEASAEAVMGFQKSRIDSISNLMEQLNNRLKPTRGAAVSIAEINHELNKLKYVGIGNVNSVVVYPDYSSKSLITHNGIVGHIMRTIHEYEYQWIKNSVLIIHSDGLSNKWNLDKYPGILNRSALLIAALIFRDFSRGNDDSAIIVYKDYAEV